jgi:Zn-finger nucleic acid-binding protein
MYRDEYERCPRCTIELVDAGSARSCTACEGMWVTEDVLREMAVEMKIPPAPVELDLIDETRPQIACPSCAAAMETVRLNRVPIDRCSGHGVWFDRGELAAVLLAFAPPA